MPSKVKVSETPGPMGNETRPFIVFYVNPETPEEVHTDTIMAKDDEDARAIAAEQHRSNTILHIRGIGETDFSSAPESTANATGQFPCARFIKGKFLPMTFSDDPLLESLLEKP